MKNNDRFLRVEDVLRILKISNTSFHRLRKNSGFIEPIILPGTKIMVWKESDIQNWIIEQN
jgi:predicted DNA-binding transcriptional regulator AlpA